MAKRLVYGDDDRVPVVSVDYPSSSIVWLDLRYADGTRASATGWVVSPTLVVTAGHCLLSPKHGAVEDALAVPGKRSRDAAPFGSFRARRVIVSDAWRTRFAKPFDYGGLVFAKGQLDLDVLGRFGWEALDNAALSALSVHVTGYPERGPTLVNDTARVTEVNDRQLFYRANVAPGQCGSPVWYEHDGGCFIAGIHNHNGEAGAATRITADVVRDLRAWSALAT